MSSIHIARHGQTLGSFNEEEVKEGISSKRFIAEDLAWQIGMTDWRPLSEMAEVLGFDVSLLGAAAADTATSPTLTEPAWERRSEIGFLKALFQTVCAVLFSPRVTFSKLKTTGGFFSPLFFYAITSGFVVATMGVVSNMATVPPVLSHLGSGSQKALAVGIALITFVFMFVLGSLITLAQAFILSGFFHLILKIIARTKESFEATLRTVCYVYGTIGISTLLPMLAMVTCIVSLGSAEAQHSVFLWLSLGLLFVISCWGTCCLFIGLKKVHHISGWCLFFVILVGIVLLIALIVAMAVVAALIHPSALAHPALK